MVRAGHAHAHAAGREAKGGPRFDWRISLGLLLALALQAAVALLWAGRAAARIDEMEQRLDRQGPVAERLARLEEAAAGTRASLDRIETKLDRLEVPRER